MGADNTTRLASSKFWIPPGKWIERDTGVVYTGAEDGSTILEKKFPFSEVPVFVRVGSIIPTAPMTPGNSLGLAAKQYALINFIIYGSAASGSFDVYEDDGISTNYLNGASSTTKMTYSRDGG